MFCLKKSKGSSLAKEDKFFNLLLLIPLFFGAYLAFGKIKIEEVVHPEISPVQLITR
jgi:hypothetical protein